MIRPAAAGAALWLALAALAPGPARAQPAAEPIRIGVLTDLSSFGSNITGQGSITAARLAVADEGGSVLGRPIVLVPVDSQNKPDVGVALARRLYDVDHVDTIIDVPQTAVALAVQAVARDRHKPLLITSAITSDLTGKACSPYTIHWADDSTALAHGTAGAVVREGLKDWFFVTADFALGTAMQAAAADVIRAGGGTVMGSVRPPTDTTDYSSYLLAAEASHAKVVGLAVVGSDLITAIKQAHEFGLQAGGQTLAAMLMFLSDVNSLGLENAGGLVVTSSFYWDQNDASRDFARRFEAEIGRKPNRTHASTYAMLRHFIAAVRSLGSTDPDGLMRRMKAMPADYLGHKAYIRHDGRVIYDLTVYRVKTPDQSRGPWDDYQELATIPGEQAFQPMDQAHCDFPGE